MLTKSPYGHPQRNASVATIAALKALAVRDNVHGEDFRLDDGSEWVYHATSALTGDDQLIVAPTSGAGRYLRKPGWIDLSLAFTFATADAAVLYTVPTGALILAGRSYWEIAADMTGGTASAIGLSGPSPHNTKGDLLGGAGGDVAATLTAALSPALGTIGADVAAGVRLKAADTVKFDRITSAFTAGSGNAHLVGYLVKNLGA